jgi:hypothetical protein
VLSDAEGVQTRPSGHGNPYVFVVGTDTLP